MTNKEIKVLYADNDPEACLMLELLLKFEGINVSSVNSIADTKRRVDSERFDVFLIDGRFNDGNGVDLCQELKKLNPNTPVVFYSANGYDLYKKDAYLAGAADFVVKPHSDQLAPTIFKLMS